LEINEKRVELEMEAKSTSAKLPKLKITPFKETVVDWIRLKPSTEGYETAWKGSLIRTDQTSYKCTYGGH
jgi:hypothetical protein